MHIRVFVATAAVIATSLLSAATPAPHTAISLLGDIQVQAADASTYASELQTYALASDVSWQSHAVALEAVKADINAIAKEVAQLRILRDSCTPEQQKAIDNAALLVAEMAANTTAAMQYLNNHQGEFWRAGYRGEVTNLLSESERLGKSAGEAVQLARLRNKEMRIDKDLGLAAE